MGRHPALRRQFNREGIEIFYHPLDGRLSLACERDVFERFRALTREELRDLPEIPVDAAVYLEITDTERHVARIEPAQAYLKTVLVIAALFVVLVPWIFGVIFMVNAFFGR